MKRKFMQLAGIALSVAMLLPQMPSTMAASTTFQSTVIVALAFDGTTSTTMAGGNILNSVGSGYRLGYLDSNRNFVQLGYTSETGISAVKTQNVYYGLLDSGLNGYTDTLTSSIAVGCYHIQLPYTYSNYEDAKAAASSVSNGFVAWVSGVYYVRVGSYLDSASATTAMAALGLTSSTVVGTSSYGISVVKTGTSTILFQFDGGADLALLCKPNLDDSVKTETWFNKYKYYGSFQFQRVTGGNLTICSVVDEDDYVNCVLSREMSDSWPLEALKAQAVAVRTYCATNYGKHASSNADVCGTTCCQVYVGCASVGDNTAQAATETSGVYAWYNGELVETYYYSCNGGNTENSENVWNEAVPYLIGKVDPYEPLIADQTGYYNWSFTFTKDELTTTLNNAGYVNSGIVNVYVSATTDMGNVYTLTFTDAAGKSWSFDKEKARTILGLNSLNYEVVGGSGGTGSYSTTDGGSLSTVTGTYVIGSDGTSQMYSGSPYVITGSGTEVLTSSVVASTTTSTSDSFTFIGSGWGHSVGMSQWGARSMAELGYSYVDILTFYYTGITVS